ncbi:MAG: hypothetical protein HND57_09500 [Planctomycetes bacterium]|nr:hypothetical protein [Planctomycetota bacterium]
MNWWRPEAVGHVVAADAILQCSFWREVQTIAELPHDADTWSAFVNSACSDLWPLDDEALERAAVMAHEAYVNGCKSSAAKHHESVLPWDEGLPDVYKRSNIHQAAYVSVILEAAGFTLLKLEHGQTPSDEEAKPAGYDEKVEEMARMEHGRYCAERVADGWRLGPDNDPVKKTNPTLVPWEELSEAMRNFDRQAVEQWPGLLSDAGLKIVPKDVGS